MNFKSGPCTTSFFTTLVLFITQAYGTVLFGIPESSNMINLLSTSSENGISRENSKSFPSLSSGGSDFQNIFSKNEDLMKYLVLLAVAPGSLDEHDQDVEDESPAIDLLHGRKPGTAKSARLDMRKYQNENAWDEPIVLHQHRRQKKSFVIPELFLRDAATSSKTQPDPQFMRTFLARISNRRLPRATFEANDDHTTGALTIAQ